MIRYAFKDGVLPIKNVKAADPQSIGESMAAAAEAAGGHLREEALHEAAKDPSHAMHQHLEWDDTVAGKLYRFTQIRQIIRLVAVADDESNEAPARAFYSIADKGGTSYRTLNDVMTSVHLQEILLAGAERDLKAFEARYRDLTDICDIVRDAREKVAKRRAKAVKAEQAATV